MPTTIASILAFAFLAGPGLLCVRGEGRVRPRARRSALTEAIEVFVYGAIPAGAAIGGGLALSSWRGWISVHALVTSPTHYYRVHPFRLIYLGLAALGFSYLVTILYVSWRVRRARKEWGTHDPDTSVWYRVVARALAGSHTELKRKGTAPDETTVPALVELLDGRQVSGYLHALDTDTDNPTHEISLRSPLWVFAPGGVQAARADADFVVIPTEQIRYMTVKSSATESSLDIAAVPSEPKMSWRQKRAAKKERAAPASVKEG